MDAVVFSAHILDPMCQKHLLTPVSSFVKWKGYFEKKEHIPLSSLSVIRL